MNVKENVLLYLENNKGDCVSGAFLADKFGVSRNAVWKAVKVLQADGYKITAVTNKGYCLDNDSDIISDAGIRRYLDEDAQSCDIKVFKTIGSTNDYAKDEANKGAKEGTIIISEEQTKGKGRMGRSFYSPAKTGIYMSIILRPKLSIEDSMLITTSTAVAVSRAIENVTGVTTKIKWVNDIYIEDKKVCGILSEASIDFESGGLEYAIVGIGINVTTKTENFPDELKNIAYSIYSHTNVSVRNRIIAEIINNMYNSMEHIADRKFLDEYRKKSFLIDRDIYVISGDKKTKAHAISIDDKARLVVEYEDKHTQALSSGEVSVREFNK